MTVAYFTGFETGDTSELNSIGGGTVQSTIVRSGAYALKESSISTLVTGLAATQTSIRVYIYFTSIPAGFPILLDALDSGSANVFNSVIAGNGTLLASGGGTSNAAGTHALKIGWNLLEYAFDVAAGGVLKSWVNGVLDINTTHPNLTNNIDRWRVNGAANPNEVYYDDIRIDTGTVTNPGAGAVIARQGASGAVANDLWTKNGAATAALCWSDTPFATGTNCSDNVNGDAQTMVVANFSNTQAGHGNEVLRSNFTVNACKVCMIAKSASAGNITIRYRRGSVTDNTVAITTADAYYEAPYFTDPPYSNLDNAQIGVVNAQVATLQTVEDMWLMVDFTGDDLMPQIVL